VLRRAHGVPQPCHALPAIRGDRLWWWGIGGAGFGVSFSNGVSFCSGVEPWPDHGVDLWPWWVRGPWRMGAVWWGSGRVGRGVLGVAFFAAGVFGGGVEVRGVPGGGRCGGGCPVVAGAAGVWGES